jgi:hypothetical protein
VFIEANVKKWGLAPASGSLAPPPPYGSEQGSILLEGGRDSRDSSAGPYMPPSLLHYGFPGRGGHSRSGSANLRVVDRSIRPPQSPGPQRSPTDISLAQLDLGEDRDDVGEGSSHLPSGPLGLHGVPQQGTRVEYEANDAPPDYESPKSTTPTEGNSPVLPNADDPPIPSYDAVMAATIPSNRRYSSPPRR